MAKLEKRAFPRVMVAAEKSGQGKTAVTCALLSLLSGMGKEVRAFKCGPDYIDPMFHRQVLQVPSYNLDSFFADRNLLRYLAGRHGGPERVGLMEGVMGYYDGLGGTTDRASAYEAAKLTDTPVVFLVDGSGRSLSTLAALRGFCSYREDSRIRGVIFNRVSPAQYPGLKRLAEEELGLRAVGYVPVLRDFSLESRHLGLMMPGEIPEFQKKVKLLADQVRPGIDMEALLSLAAEAPELSWETPLVPSVRETEGVSPMIAVAMDEAFCFYYQDNLELLEKMGAELCFFSPLRDKRIPEGTDGLYLGGGYPELHGKELSGNRALREEIRAKLADGLPCIAECGGYLYLQESLRDLEGTPWPMVGALPGEGANAGRLVHFGYVTLTAKEDGLLGKAGTSFPAHEFHHWASSKDGAAFHAQKPVGNRGWDVGFTTKTLYAGFPHLYFYSCPPYGFLRQAAEYGKRKGKA